MDRGHYNQDSGLSLAIQANPGALFFKETERVVVEARVCADCGLTELYASDPAALWAAAEKRRQNI
jgi:hypothetical protein